MTKDERWLLEEKYAGDRTSAFEVDRERLACGEPLGYVIGWQPFLGLKINLDSHPLIPRPETEWWTEQLLSSLLHPSPGGGADPGASAARSSMVIPAPKGSCAGICEGEAERGSSQEEPTRPPNPHCRKSLSFLDLCAGSGAIGCAALAKLPDARVYFGELDPAHEATIRKNIRENNLDASRADIRIGDLFEPFGNMTFDVIAANPPYIPAGRELPASVTGYEPALALTAGKDGLAVIRRIAHELPKRLAPGGVAWIECDSAHAAAACALFAEQGLAANVLADQYGTLRIVRAEKQAGNR